MGRVRSANWQLRATKMLQIKHFGISPLDFTYRFFFENLTTSLLDPEVDGSKFMARAAV